MLSVIFDMDGVIFDTEVLCRRAWHACSGKYGVKDVDSLLASCIGGNRERMLEVLKHVMGEDFPALDFLEDAYAVEDSYNGVRSASRAGMRTIMMPDLLPPTEEMEKLAYRILPDLCCVKELFVEST